MEKRKDLFVLSSSDILFNLSNELRFCLLTSTNSSGIFTPNVNAFIALDLNNSLIVVSFRGTCGGASAVNLISAGLRTAPVAPDFACGGCGVQAGFFHAWQSVEVGVVGGVRTLLAANSKFKVVTTGHSLGGAYAQYAGFQLRLSFPTAIVDIVSYKFKLISRTY
jgi:hypothetical protein